MAEDSKEKLIFFIVCLVLVFSIYGRTLWGDFVFDDRSIVDYRSLLQISNLSRILSLPYWTQAAGLYRPITLFSYALNYSFFGNSPWSFHLLNLILYSWSGYLIFLLLKMVFGRRRLAALVAIMFLVFPIHGEVAANITGRSEILALFFSLLMFLEITREKPRAGLAGLWFLLAIGSKETAIAALPLAILIAYFKVKENPDTLEVDLAGGGISTKGVSLEVRAWKYALSFGYRCPGGQNYLKYFYPALAILISTFIYFLARFLVLGDRYFSSAAVSVVENPLKFVPALERVATAFKILTIYLQKSLWPIGLCSDYSYNQIPVLHNFLDFRALFGLFIFLLLVFCALFFFRRRRIVSLAASWFIFAFLPISNLIFPTGTIAGERLMYYPSVGICIFLALVFLRLGNLRSAKVFQWLAIFLFVALVLFYGVVSFRRGGDWMTEKKLFHSAVKCAPNSVLSRSNLGAVYYLEGDLAEAKKELLTAQNIYGGYPKGINNLGLVYWKEGDKEKAREYFLKALSPEFPFYGAYENLALMDLEDGNYDEAKKWLLEFYSGNEKVADFYIAAYLENTGGGAK